ncbi:MAG: hypothetical protein CENE_03800 [Candidatus Celerinatantimonas neptuna]|nr:MAG: hypothetical protein CENE_03800 [Candidatus Celerinatantimonas neptuna]
MIGIDPKTGKTVTGYDALQCRFARILTTPVTSRVKRRAIGNWAVERVGQIQSPAEAMIVQNLTLEALANEANGLTEFKAMHCTATQGSKGFLVTVEGIWQGDSLTLSGAL